MESVRKLAEYTIARHDPALVTAPQPLPGAAAERGRASGCPDRAVDERGFHPWRDEHRQHDDIGRDDRLRAVRLHGGLRSRRGVQLHRPPGTLRLRQPARHRVLEPGTPGRNAAAPAVRRSRAGGRDGHRGHRCVPGAVPQAPAPRTARQARAASRRTGRRQRRCRAGRRLVVPASCRARGFHPRVAAARRRRRRRRSAAARAVCRCARARRMAGPLAGTLRQRRRQRSSMARRWRYSSAPRRCAASIPS